MKIHNPIIAAAALAIPSSVLVAGASVFFHETDTRASHRLPDRVAARLGLIPGRGTIGQQIPRESIAACTRTQGNGSCQVQVHDANGDQMTLHLSPFNLRSSTYQLRVQDGDGNLVAINPGPSTTFRGFDESNCEGAASFFQGRMTAERLCPNGRQYIDPLGAGDEYVAYTNADVIKNPEKTCSVLPRPARDLVELGVDSHDNTTSRQLTNDHHRPPHPPHLRGSNRLLTGPSPVIAELAIDSDYEYYVNHGSDVYAVQARIESVINAMNVQYETEVGITHVITTIIVRTVDDPNPYTSTSAGFLLNQFRLEWDANQAGTPRDVAQLFTGKDMDNGIIGIAWAGTVCHPTHGYSLVQSDHENNFASATDISAHELGHNWGASHCNCQSNTMHASATSANTFHPTETRPTIEQFRDSIYDVCLSTLASPSCQYDSDCEDNIPCTMDSCDTSTGTGICRHYPNDDLCDNGIFCDGQETCNTIGGCMQGNDPCDDGILCTEDICDEVNSTCSNVANNTLCETGLFCDGINKTCDPIGGCQVVGERCPGQFCDESTDECVDCLIDTDCSDGLFCTGEETCSSGICNNGTAPCGPGLCEEDSGICLECLVDDDCPNDGLYCNGVDICSSGFCEAGPNPCTPLQTCSEAICLGGCGGCSDETTCLQSPSCNWTKVDIACVDPEPCTECLTKTTCAANCPDCSWSNKDKKCTDTNGTPCGSSACTDTPTLCERSCTGTQANYTCHSTPMCGGTGDPCTTNDECCENCRTKGKNANTCS